jgi:chromosome segregation ATPase
LDFQITEYENEFKSIKTQVKAEAGNVEKINFEINNLRKILNNNEENFSKLNDKIKNAKISNEKMELIGEKIKQRDELKENIQKFKKECLEEKQILENQIDALERKNEKMNEKENFEVFEEIDKNYNETYEKLLDKKKDLFEQNKIINLLTRRIQVFPSKLELIQYQKRFQELYDQINNVVEKLKNLINEVNSKEEVKKLLNQKVIWLNIKFFIF